ncbi:hypothetical protein HOY80DRAFT_943790 [Tuber brumale]|nr:hypothetical protein HOY80DRAFT_996377 [Tuber brumale]KAG0643813.1 hypothetical protein HOY80DRAFT_943790 [Tuber brumale]
MPDTPSEAPPSSVPNRHHSSSLAIPPQHPHSPNSSDENGTNCYNSLYPQRNPSPRANLASSSPFHCASISNANLPLSHPWHRVVRSGSCAGVRQSAVHHRNWKSWNAAVLEVPSYPSEIDSGCTDFASSIGIRGDAIAIWLAGGLGLLLASYCPCINSGAGAIFRHAGIARHYSGNSAEGMMGNALNPELSTYYRAVAINFGSRKHLNQLLGYIYGYSHSPRFFSTRRRSDRRLKAARLEVMRLPSTIPECLDVPTARLPAICCGGALKANLWVASEEGQFLNSLNLHKKISPRIPSRSPQFRCPLDGSGGV